MIWIPTQPIQQKFNNIDTEISIIYAQTKQLSKHFLLFVKYNIEQEIVLKHTEYKDQASTNYTTF